MDTAIRHRGPDEHGQKRLDRAVMGHCRLAIIDLAGGQQPMCSPDEHVWIDTEVLLHAYLVWGEKRLGRLTACSVS